ncbi:helix-turn-helix transcriptional regulator [Listeria monocytogenes]|nr:helix-turn-helix transcriptional regulator [Listeria monocytogenes]
MELNKFVGNKIKQYREERGLNQEALAEKLHTTRQTISRYENGYRKANQDVLFELAKIFNKRLDDFFPERNLPPVDERLVTIAAHIDDDVTEEEMRDILAYIEMKKKLHRGM